MSSSKKGLSQQFPPELMDQSRVTNRGNSYSSKSRSNSIMNSLVISNVSPVVTNTNQRHSENIQYGFDAPKQRQTLAVFQDIEERTHQKAPIYREVEVPERDRRSQNRMKMQKENGLLAFHPQKRTLNGYQQQLRPSLLMVHLKQRPMEPIREQAMQIESSQASASEIDSDFQIINSSYSTDISSQ